MFCDSVLYIYPLPFCGHILYMLPQIPAGVRLEERKEGKEGRQAGTSSCACLALPLGGSTAPFEGGGEALVLNPMGSCVPLNNLYP